MAGSLKASYATARLALRLLKQSFYTDYSYDFKHISYLQKHNFRQICQFGTIHFIVGDVNHIGWQFHVSCRLTLARPDGVAEWQTSEKMSKGGVTSSPLGGR